jgi:hypothetical protein
MRDTIRDIIDVVGLPKSRCREVGYDWSTYGRVGSKTERWRIFRQAVEVDIDVQILLQHAISDE